MMARVVTIWIFMCVAVSAAAQTPAGGPPPVKLIPQETSVWCWAASAEMILDALGGMEPHSQRRQVERLYGLADCSYTDCAYGDTTAACEKTGFPQFYKYGFDAEVTRPLEAFEWPKLAAELRCRPIAFAWENRTSTGQLTGDGHMVVLTGARAVRIGSDDCGWHLGGWIAVNDPASVRDPFEGTCSANREVWSFGRYRRKAHWIHYYGFRPAGKPVPSCISPTSSDEANEVFAIFESVAAESLVQAVTTAFGGAGEGDDTDDIAWLRNAAGLEGATDWRCNVEHPLIQEAIDLASLREASDATRLADLVFPTDSRRFLCTASEEQVFSIEVDQGASGMWQLGSIGASATAGTIESHLKEASRTGREVREVYVQGLNVRFLRLIDGNPEQFRPDRVIPISPIKGMGLEAMGEDEAITVLRSWARRLSVKGPS